MWIKLKWVRRGTGGGGVSPRPHLHSRWSRACHVVCGQRNWNLPWTATEMMSSAVGQLPPQSTRPDDRRRVGKNLDAIIHIKRNTHEASRVEMQKHFGAAQTQRVEGVCPAATAATRSRSRSRICLNSTDPPTDSFPGNCKLQTANWALGTPYHLSPNAKFICHAYNCLTPFRSPAKLQFYGACCSVCSFIFFIFILCCWCLWLVLLLLCVARRLAKAAILMKTFWPSPTLSET